jgi:hypothetical protein
VIVRPALLATLALVTLAGCAEGQLLGLPSGPYRATGLSPLPNATGDDGTPLYRLELAGGVVYDVQARIDGGQIAVRTRVENGTDGPVRIDLDRAALVEREGTNLTLSRVEDDPGWTPDPEERAAAPWKAGQRTIPPGKAIAVTRRYKLASAPMDGAGIARLGRVQFKDEVQAGGRAQPVKVELVRD